MARADAATSRSSPDNFRKTSQQLVALRTLEIQRERAAARLLAAEARQTKMATEKMKTADAEAQLAEARLAVERVGARKVDGCLLKDFFSIKTKRDAMRKAEGLAVDGACLNKMFADDACQYRLQARTLIKACQLKLLQLSGEAINPDIKFPDFVWKLFHSGWPLVTGTIADGTLKEVGRETIFGWCYEMYLCEDSGPAFRRPLLITQSEYDCILETFKTLFERSQHYVPAHDLELSDG
jgi:hypothetical protein